MELSKDERILLAKALNFYKNILKVNSEKDLVNYNKIEMGDCDALADKLELSGDYYEY